VSNRQVFEAMVLPHLDAAYNLARWLMRSEQSAEDAVQEASMRAFRYIETLRGGDARPWLLGIVRNTCFTMLERTRSQAQWIEFDEAGFEAALVEAPQPDADPVLQLQQQRTRLQVDAAIRALSPPLREVIVLREFEELDYAQIAKIAGVPIGTVMSRLARARGRLRAALSSITLGE